MFSFTGRPGPFLLHIKKSMGHLLFTVLVVLLFLFGRHKIIGSSMYPTFQEGQAAYTVRAFLPPRRGDVVISLSAQGTKFLIKRVAGIPGDTIEIRPDGSVWVNGEPYAYGVGNAMHSKGFGGMAAHSDGSMSSLLSEGEYFLLGDNLEGSFDSRYYGPFPRWKISELVLYVK